MKTIRVYDPAMCCNTGVCGPDVDPELAQFAAFLAELQRHQVVVERFNLGHQPMAFVQNARVKALLETEGVAALPLVFKDDELMFTGAYPDAATRVEWLAAAAARGTA